MLTHLQDLRRQAKEAGFKGYSTLSKLDLQLLLAGKPVPKRMKKNQVSVESQTDFRPCINCGLEAMMTHLCFKAEAGRRIAYDGDLEIDVATGEAVGCGIKSGIKFLSGYICEEVILTNQNMRAVIHILRGTGRWNIGSSGDFA